MASNQPTPAIRHFPAKRHYVLIISVLGLGVGVIGLSGVESSISIKHAGVPAADQTATRSPDKPSEQPVPPSYSVPADQPKAISLSTIQTEGFIQKVGVDKANTIVAPSNIHMAGWFADSVKPGNPGLSIIDGHVQGKYGRGIFYSLGHLKPKDNFKVTYGDNSIINFRVIKVDTVAVDQATKSLFSRAADIKNQLNIITCGGKYNTTSQTYEQRVIVTATRID